MKIKHILLALIFLAPFSAFASGEVYTRTPSGSSFTVADVTLTLTDSSEPHYNCEFNGGSQWYFEITDSLSNTYDGATRNVYTDGSDTFILPAGDYVSVVFVCHDHPAGNHDFGDSFTLTPPPPPAFDIELANATSTFSATTGFDISGVITWAGDNLIKLFIGTGLAILYSIRGWLVAMVVIGAIVYFAYRAFRFFRH